MPRRTKSLPRICKAAGQSVVYLNGHRVYLGPHGSRLARERYDRIVAEWLQRGRVSAPEPEGATVAAVMLS